jgi:cysteinyl-tRNA synthetase
MLLRLARLTHRPWLGRFVHCSSGQSSVVLAHNSLSGQLESLGRFGDTLSWYTCGPTVYDVSHLGHARTYVTVDILQRVMENFFGLSVHHIMNVTDIDEKILNRAKEQKKDWRELARTCEASFFRDMERLNVRMPSTVLRVTDHIDEIQSMIRKIIENGFAYERQGSVYLDSQAFRNSNSNSLAFRLGPCAGDHDEHHGHSQGNTQSNAQSNESKPIIASEDKKHPNDFVLWRGRDRSHAVWESPWGPGQPGWHIECSAMISSLYRSLDVHAGGIDLKFPHHQNELIQADAFYNQSNAPSNGASVSVDWVKHFLHIGHLHIQGQKMSKSLKNFVTIDQFLQRHTANQFRLFCLLHRFDKPIDYNEESFEIAKSIEFKLRNSLGDIEHALKLTRGSSSESEARWSTDIRKWSNEDAELLRRMNACNAAMLKRLHCNFDTTSAVHSLLDFAGHAQGYATQHGASANMQLLRRAGEFVSSSLHKLGMQGFDKQHANATADAQALDVLLEFRKQTRLAVLAGTKPYSAAEKNVLKLCDKLRDEQLPQLGVQLKDQADGSFTLIRSE